MICRMQDLCEKNVVSLEDGACIGCVDDAVIDTECAKIISLVVFGRKKFFGLFGREPDIIIAWKDIEMIGEDAILVNSVQQQNPCRKRRNQKFFGRFCE